MKRFYKFASLGEAKEGFSILLDGKPVKTPGRNLLQTEHRDLANAVMQEWLAQGEKILPRTMHLTQFLSTKIDRVGENREEMTAALMKYLDTDLLCYRAAEPPEVAQRQQQIWNPWLAWFEKEYGVPLATTTGLKALTQPEAAHKAVRSEIESMDDDHFTVFQVVAPLCGSVVLALAFMKKSITPEQLFAAARVEENYKAELYDEKKYGPDPAQVKKDKEALEELDAGARFLDLLS